MTNYNNVVKLTSLLSDGKDRHVALPGLRDLLAWRNLAHDKVRFFVTLIGIVFSVTLMAVQTGLLTGFVTTISKIVDKTDADLWLVGRGVRSIDLPANIPERRRFQVLGVDGVAAADPFMHVFAQMKRPDGGAESVAVVGYDLATGRGGPGRSPRAISPIWHCPTRW